jgi:hypothetical protein
VKTPPAALYLSLLPGHAAGGGSGPTPDAGVPGDAAAADASTDGPLRRAP